MKGFAHVGVIVAIALALLGVGYVAFVARAPERPPAEPTSGAAPSFQDVLALDIPQTYSITYHHSWLQKIGELNEGFESDFTIYKDKESVRIDRNTNGILGRQYFVSGKGYACEKIESPQEWACHLNDELQSFAGVFDFAENKQNASYFGESFSGVQFRGFTERKNIAGVESVCFTSERRASAVEGSPLETITKCFHPDLFIKLSDSSALENDSVTMKKTIVATRVSFDPIPEEIFRLPSDKKENGVVPWKTYRNEEYGIEFRYPERISGKTVTPTALMQTRRGWLSLNLYTSSMPYAPSYPSEMNLPGEAPSLRNFLSISVVDLRQYPYLRIGEDMGYEYDTVRKRWIRQILAGPNGPPVTWDQFFEQINSFFSTSRNNRFPIPVSKGVFAFWTDNPGAGGDFFTDPNTRYYYLIHEGLEKYIILGHFAVTDVSTFTPSSSLRTQFETEANLVSEITKEILKTIRFLP